MLLSSIQLLYDSGDTTLRVVLAASLFMNLFQCAEQDRSSSFRRSCRALEITISIDRFGTDHLADVGMILLRLAPTCLEW